MSIVRASAAAALLLLGLSRFQGHGLAAVDAETLKRSVAANRWRIARFQTEYEEMMSKQAGSAEMYPGVAERLKELQKEIHLLLSDNERLLSLISKAEGKPAPEEKPPLDDNLKGMDWMKMSQNDKELYIFHAIGALEVQGVFMMQPPYFYIHAIDESLTQDKSLQAALLDNIFVLTVYQNEPQTHEVLKRIWLDKRKSP